VASPVQASGTNRRINTAGQDIVEGIKVEGNLIVQQTATSRRDRADEYQVEFRGVLELIRGVRDWLTADERQSLNDRASLLGLRPFEQRDVEQTILDTLLLQLREKPSEFWWVASTSAHLVKEAEFGAAVQAVAGLLDSHDADKLFASLDHGVTWTKLPTVAPLFDAARRARGARFQQGLSEWVRRGQPPAGVANLHHMSRGLTNPEIQAARREAERICAKQITIPPAQAAVTSKVESKPAVAVLDGTWEAEGNPSVRVVIKDGLVRMKTTSPIVRAGQARIVATTREAQEFVLGTKGVDGELAGLKQLSGNLVEDRLVVRTIDGLTPALCDAFRTTYRRV